MCTLYNNVKCIQFVSRIQMCAFPESIKKELHAFQETHTMHNNINHVLCLASFCAHLCAISNIFNYNDENGILST